MSAAAAAPLRWQLLSRPDCHLCEDFELALREHLAERAGGRRLELQALDVDSRGEWRLRYGNRIPVLLDEAGQVLAEGIFDADTFDRNFNG